jgi:hypothetical protein
MTEHKARPEPWQADAARWLEAILELRDRIQLLEDAAQKHIVETSANILALASRVETLESTQQQPEPINEGENNRRFHACMDLIRNATPEQIRTAAELSKRPASKVYEINEPLQLTPEQARQVRDLLAPDSKPAPNFSQIGSSLVERVQGAQMESVKERSSMARAAIREIAAWLREQQDGDLVAATVLEREAER